jgi:Arm DNA-binding domain
MALSDLAIKRALPGAKIVKLSDGGGLQLWITPDGAKRWRIAYRFGGSQKTLAVGVYPKIGLKGARDAREAARKTLAQGQDPSQVKKATKAAKAEAGANTFAAIAGELAEKKRRDKKAAATMRKFDWFHELRPSGARLATDRGNLGARGPRRAQGGRGARNA